MLSLLMIVGIKTKTKILFGVNYKLFVRVTYTSVIVTKLKIQWSSFRPNSVLFCGISKDKTV